MAATNPFKVSDLIKKYGWTIMPYLSNLGVRSLAEAQVLFVDSGNTAHGADADDGEHGHSFEKPLLTADYATGLCTADEGAIILFAPGHNENLSAAINFDVAGVTYIGLGSGTLRPRFDFDAAASSINIGANNVTLANLTFMPGYADVLIGVDIEASVTNARIVDCEFVEGEASGDEFLAAIELKAGCHDTVVENNIFRAGWSSNPDDGVSLKGASNNVTIRNNRFSGPYGDGAGVTAAISNSTGVCLDLLIENNIMKVKDGESGIEVIATTPAVCRHNTIISTGCTIDSMIVGTIAELDQNIGITTDGTSGEVIGGGTVAPEIVAYNLDHLAKTADGALAYPASVTTNSILGMIMSTDGDVSNFDKSTDSLQSIRDAIAAIDNTTNLNTAVPDTPTAKSLQDILSKADGANTYDNTTDSLEAISEALAAGTGCTAAIDADSLDKLVGTSDTDQAYPASLVSHSILSSIISSDGNPAGYDRATDSLEAIADAIAALSWATAVSQSPTARSMQDILEKDNSGSFDDATDSLEAIRDHLDGTTILDGIQLDHLAKTASAGTNYPTEVTTDSFLGMIMSTNGNPNGFNKTTDSLQAIRDHLDGTTVLGGIYLDHLSKTADGASNYPASMTTNSQLAMIMASDGDPTGYNKTTDSLEAIRDHLDGATVLAGIQLDTLAGVDTTIGIDGDLEAHCVAGSLLAHVLSKTKDATAYKCSTDSLQAISDKVGAFSGDGGAAADDSVKALLDLMATDIATILADTEALDSSTELRTLIFGSDTAGATATALATAQTDLDTITGASGVNLLTATQASIDAIEADTAVIEPGARRIVLESTGDLTAFGLSRNLFTVSGDVLVRVCASVDVAVTSTSGTTTLEVGVAGNTACLCVQDVVDNTAFAIGDSWSKTVAASDNGAEIADEFVLVGNSATIILTGSVDDITAGDIDFYCEWIPLSSGATVTAAA